MNTPIDAAIDSFIFELMVRRGLSRSTIEAYGRTMRRFAAWLIRARG